MRLILKAEKLEESRGLSLRFHLPNKHAGLCLAYLLQSVNCPHQRALSQHCNSCCCSDRCCLCQRYDRCCLWPLQKQLRDRAERRLSHARSHRGPGAVTRPPSLPLRSPLSCLGHCGSSQRQGMLGGQWHQTTWLPRFRFLRVSA